MRSLSWLKLFIASGILCGVQSAAHAQAPATRLSRLIPWAPHQVGKKPETGSDKSIEELAKNIDWLENRLNLYGTVVPKTPDVWGEARLTAHRQEFEEMLKRELTAFNKNAINGAESVKDNAFLAFALAMNNGIRNPDVPAAEIRSGTVGPGVSAVVIEQSKEGETPKTSTSGGGAFATIAAPTDLGPVFQYDPSKITLGDQITVEQTEVLDQLARYLNHLHQIRRINEGDDTSDAPGYSMNLVRIPVSILPGEHTKIGYGAEITVTAEPYLGPELLPMAFRDFVINDLVDQLSLPMTRFINSNPAEVDEMIRSFQVYNRRESQIRQAIDAFNGLNICVKEHPEIQAPISNFLHPTKQVPPTWQIIIPSDTQISSPASLAGLRSSVEFVAERLKYEYAEAKTTFEGAEPSPVLETKHITKDPTKVFIPDLTVKALRSVEVTPLRDDSSGDGKKPIDKLIEAQKAQEIYDQQKFLDQGTKSSLAEVERSLSAVATATKSLSKTSINLPAGTTRRSTLPFPPSQLISNYGYQQLAEVITGIYFSLRADVINREVVHMTDIQAILREELAAAYELLRQDNVQELWAQASLPEGELYSAIRRRDHSAITKLRQDFMHTVLGCDNPSANVGYKRTFNETTECKPFEELDLSPHDRTTAVLAWCIYVESILLNERLNQDIRETLGNKPSYQACNGWAAFLGPNPSDDARMLFNDYVQTRWPIKIFALDPQNNEQNIGDVRSLFRQMQMSIALAFATGQTRLSTALQSMRKLQRDAATIDLNRTAVGFGHGDDTFGWRFYPRFQTPPVEGNAKVLFRDLIVGGPTDKQLERGRQIEPGMRECTAIVLMPSFVPHVTFTTRSNWFRLGKQGLTADSVEDTVEYSRAIKQMETNANTCIRCSHLYRDGEVDRMVKRIKQLDRRLPLQTLECQVPVENSLGGFEIFSAGTRELSPELTGWYGAPGYDPHRGGTMFLTGDNFSVTGSKLIVGNQMVHARLISRQILEVTLPPGLATVRDRRLQKENKVGQSQDEGYFNEDVEGYVDAHIATPYGVSGHLLIPVVHTPHEAIDQVTVIGNEIALHAKLDEANNSIKAISKVGPLDLLTLLVPQGSPLAGDKRTIQITLSSGSEVLTSSKEIELESDGSGTRFRMSANTAINQLNDNNEDSLMALIKQHLDYLLFIKDGKIAEVEYDGVVTVVGSSGYSSVDADGSLKIRVSITP